jgi:PAS domain-containing protein
VAYGEIDGDDCIIVGEYADGLPVQPARFSWGNLGGSRTADILKGGTLSVNDTSTEPHTVEERAALQAAGIGAYICPLLIKDGRFVGSFGIHSRSPRVWTPDEIALVQEVADRIWATLEHRRAEAELRGNEERLAFLLRLNDALRPLSDPAAVQETAARLLGEHLCASRVGYAEFEGREYVIRCEYRRGVRTNHADWDDAFSALFGFAAEEPKSFETWLARVHVEDRPRLLVVLEEILHTKDMWDHTYRAVLPDGSVSLQKQSITSGKRWPPHDRST